MCIYAIITMQWTLLHTRLTALCTRKEKLICSLRLSNTNSSLLRLSAHHLVLAASASQPLKSGTLSLYLSVPVPVLIPFVVISRPTTASRPSTPLNPSPLAPQIRLCWPLCAFINYIYLLTSIDKLERGLTALSAASWLVRSSIWPLRAFIYNTNAASQHSKTDTVEIKVSVLRVS